KLRCFYLSDYEWKILEQMQPLFELFKNVTLRMSKKDVATIHQVIPIHDTIRTGLDKICEEEKLLKAICIAASNGFEISDKYYSLTDDSIVYFMHPSYKLAYFKQQQWEKEWMDRVLEIVNGIWKNRYLPHLNNAANAKPQVSFLIFFWNHYTDVDLELFNR
ncbi:hypothetical protein M422DRAFT_190652, partial [Sphaerobolus stellatus SS14]